LNRKSGNEQELISGRGAIADRYLAPIPGNPLAGLDRADQICQQLCRGALPVPTVVTEDSTPLAAIATDVVVCGGTLGIFWATALAVRGWRVAVVERGTLRGRDQEWNISRHELQSLLDAALLTAAELETAIAQEFNPVQVRIHGGEAIAVRDVLNLGVDPVYLLDRLKARFQDAGGILLEQTAFQGATIHPNGVALTLQPRSGAAGAGGQGGAAVYAPDSPATGASDPTRLTTRLLVDAMGHQSPLTRQARQGQPPDSVCLVVGTCATGCPEPQAPADLIATIAPATERGQAFWEAFPARTGRTTYLFRYCRTADLVGANPLTLRELFGEYFQELPHYQGLPPAPAGSDPLALLTFQRALFGFFPAYRASPLTAWRDRLLPVGDSSGAQSPLSFGGFGAMLHHLGRLTEGIDAALRRDRLTQADLAGLQPYQPNLAVPWLFQQTMSARPAGDATPEQCDRINRLLRTVFAEMASLGEPVLKPFLQDVVQFGPLLQILTLTGLKHPGLVAQLLPELAPALPAWLGHYGALGLYDLLGRGAEAIAPWAQTWPDPAQAQWQRWRDTWIYGAGRDG
jgi:lycopene cyclase CruP